MKITPLLLLAGAFGLVATAQAAPVIVAVSGTARQDYTQAKFPAGHPPTLQTYAFYQGNYFSGQTRDPSLDKTSFHDIALALAQPLAADNFLPDRDASRAQILLVVHWGVTTVNQSPITDFEEQDMNVARNNYNTQPSQIGVGGSKSPGGLSAAPNTWGSQIAFTQDQQYADQLNSDQRVAYNANLLGFGTTLDEQAKKYSFFQSDTGPARTLRDMLSEERYFLILMACDYPTLQKTHQQKILWTVRVSTPANGTEFPAVLPALAAEAARYAGWQSKSVRFDSVAPRD